VFYAVPFGKLGFCKVYGRSLDSVEKLSTCVGQLRDCSFFMICCWLCSMAKTVGLETVNVCGGWGGGFEEVGVR
jgi:hypothetical protein